MDDNRLRFGVGVLVIAAIGIGIILTFLFGAVPSVLNDEIRLFVSFPSAEGINTNTPVLFRGIEIGRVIKKQLQDDDVLVTLGIDREYQDKLTYEYVPQIGTGSFITGDSKLEFVKLSDEDLLTRYQDQWPALRGEIYTDEAFLKNGINKTDPFSVLFNLEDELKQTLESVQDASGALRQVGDNFDGLVGDARGVVGQADTELNQVAQEARKALIEFQGAMRDVRGIIGDEEVKANLKASLAELPNIVQEIDTTLKSTQDTFRSFEKVGEQFESVGKAAEKTVKNVDTTIDSVRETVQSAQRSFGSAERAIANIETITEPIAENSGDLVVQVLKSLGNLDRTLRQVETFGSALNNSNGTIRRLLDDDELYWNLRRTVENVEMATAKIRPILDDVRVFSDKIARDPRELGVRGALSKRGSGLGLK